MIAKATTISNTKAALLYGDDLGKDAQIIFRNYLFGETPSEITREFKTFQSQNKNCNRNTISFIISPTISDGKKISSRDFNKTCKAFLKEMKLEDHQSIGYVHQDKRHLHVHLYVNRINFKGKAFDTGFIGKRAQFAAKKVAVELGLTTVDQVKQNKLDKTKQVRKEIKNTHDSILIKKPKDVKEYIEKMKEKGIFVKPVVNKQNKLQGFRYEYYGNNFKGSEVHRNMSINKLPIPKKLTLKNDQIKLLNNHEISFSSILFNYSETEQSIKKQKRKWQR